jgi:hypothetical protein
MGKFLMGRMRVAILPTVIVTLVLGALWVWGWWGYGGRAGDDGVGVGVLAGWLTAMFLVATAAAIICAASGKLRRSDSDGVAARDSDDARGSAKGRNWRSDRSSGEGQRGQVFLGFAMIVDACGILLAIVALTTRRIGVGDVVRIYFVLAAWVAMWVQLTWLLRQMGPRMGAGAASVTAALAMLLFAAPVTAVPLVRASGAWGPGVQERVIRGVAVGTPMLGALDAMRGSVGVGWAQRSEMYRLSGLGQDVPMGPANWWVNALTYGGIAAGAWGLARLAERRRHRREEAE